MRLLNPFVQFPPHFVQFFYVFRIAGEIVDFVRIGVAIVEFLLRFGWREEKLLRGV